MHQAHVTCNSCHVMWHTRLRNIPARKHTHTTHHHYPQKFRQITLKWALLKTLLYAKLRPVPALAFCQVFKKPLFFLFFFEIFFSVEKRANYKDFFLKKFYWRNCRRHWHYFSCLRYDQTRMNFFGKIFNDDFSDTNHVIYWEGAECQASN